MNSPLKSLLAACVFAASPFGAGAAELAPHQAGYTVVMDENRDASVTAVSGQVMLGLQQVCEGWLQQQSNMMNMHLPSGDVVPQSVNFSSLESGTTYRFSTKVGGSAEGSTLGRAEMPADGGAGRAVYGRPKDTNFVLPPGTLFPMAHARFLIDGAQSGKMQLQSHIFEGVEVEGAKLLVAFVTPLSDRAKGVVNAVGGDFLHRPGWNFRLAYFDPANQTGEPLYEVEVDLLDNGVALRWILDYGTFSVEMKLAKVEAVAPPHC